MERIIKSFRDIARVLFVSPEFFIIIVSLSVGYFSDSIPIASVKAIFPASINAEKLKWIALLPFGLFIYSLSRWRDILSPEHKAESILTAWSDYHLLNLTFRIGLLYQFIFVGCSVTLWFLEECIRTQYGFPIFIGSIVGAIVSTATHYFAAIRMRLLLNSVNVNHARQPFPKTPDSQ